VGHHTEAFVGIDTSKSCNAIAIADGGRGGEVRYLGEFSATAEIVWVGRSLGGRNSMPIRLQTGGHRPTFRKYAEQRRGGTGRHLA
jgi:hypothetical protein